MSKKVRIAVVGMGFGRCFAALYSRHPEVEYVGLCDQDPRRLREAAEPLGITRLHTALDEVLASPEYDAVHIATRVDQHAGHCVRALDAGKHCASAVPMGLSLEELERVRQAQRRSGLSYMMMETAIYGMEYLYAKDLHRSGGLGTIQFLQGYHSQDLSGCPTVWRGFPPMWYITHALSPLLDIVDGQVDSVSCLGSGVAEDGLCEEHYVKPYPVAAANFRLRGMCLAAQVTRTMFDVAPFGGEGFNIWGSKRTLIFVGPARQVTLGPPSAWKGRSIQEVGMQGPRPRPDLLPPELAPEADGGHGGSHPHLAHEFISSIVERRQPYIHADRAAAWSAPGICAHQSMLAGGQPMSVPVYAEEKSGRIRGDGG